MQKFGNFGHLILTKFRKKCIGGYYSPPPSSAVCHGHPSKITPVAMVQSGDPIFFSYNFLSQIIKSNIRFASLAYRTSNTTYVIQEIYYYFVKKYQNFSVRLGHARLFQVQPLEILTHLRNIPQKFQNPFLELPYMQIIGTLSVQSNYVLLPQLSINGFNGFNG